LNGTTAGDKRDGNSNDRKASRRRVVAMGTVTTMQDGDGQSHRCVGGHGVSDSGAWRRCGGNDECSDTNDPRGGGGANVLRNSSMHPT
jgi:hypothetical protein